MRVRYDALWPTTQENFNRNLVDFLADPLFAKLAVEDDASGTPVANTLYKGLIPKAWLHYQQTGTPTILDDENIDSVTDFAAGQFIPILDRDMSAADAWAAAGVTRSTHLVALVSAPGVDGATFATQPRQDGSAAADQDDTFLLFFGRQT